MKYVSSVTDNIVGIAILALSNFVSLSHLYETPAIAVEPILVEEPSQIYLSGPASTTGGDFTVTLALASL